MLSSRVVLCWSYMHIIISQPYCESAWSSSNVYLCLFLCGLLLQTRLNYRWRYRFRANSPNTELRAPKILKIPEQGEQPDHLLFELLWTLLFGKIEFTNLSSRNIQTVLGIKTRFDELGTIFQLEHLNQMILYKPRWPFLKLFMTRKHFYDFKNDPKCYVTWAHKHVMKLYYDNRSLFLVTARQHKILNFNWSKNLPFWNYVVCC